MAATRSAEELVSRRWWTRAGALDVRRIASDPLLPIPLLTVGFGGAAALGAWWLGWLLFAFLAGHSLSGST